MITAWHHCFICEASVNLNLEHVWLALEQALEWMRKGEEGGGGGGGGGGCVTALNGATPQDKEACRILSAGLGRGAGPRVPADGSSAAQRFFSWAWPLQASSSLPSCSPSQNRSLFSSPQSSCLLSLLSANLEEGQAQLYVVSKASPPWWKAAEGIAYSTSFFLPLPLLPPPPNPHLCSIVDLCLDATASAMPLPCLFQQWSLTVQLASCHPTSICARFWSHARFHQCLSALAVALEHRLYILNLRASFVQDVQRPDRLLLGMTTLTSFGPSSYWSYLAISCPPLTTCQDHD